MSSFWGCQYPVNLICKPRHEKGAGRDGEPAESEKAVDVGGADVDEGKRLGMGDTREGAMDRFGAVVVFDVASVGIVCQLERGIPSSIVFEEGGFGVFQE